jgi:catechol 2,3-dioxygenase-like lactoylglutathione lyase family enzyme
MALDILEINHVNITVPKDEEDAAKRFYGKVLGLEEIPKPASKNGPAKPEGAWYRQGALQLHLSVEEASNHHQSKRHICYLVSDLAEAEAELRRAGIEIFLDLKPVEGWPRFYVRDPGGNRIEIAQRTS